MKRLITSFTLNNRDSFSPAMVLMPLLVHYAGGSLLFAFWSVIVMLSAAGYGSMFQRKLSVSLPPTLRTSTGLVVLVVANQALIALQVSKLVNPSTAKVTAGVALLIFDCHAQLRRLHPRSKEGPLSRDSLICLGATGVLLVDHSPAWGFALAVLGGGAILALFPS